MFPPPSHSSSLVPLTLSHSLTLKNNSKFYDRLKELRDYHKRFPVYDTSAGGPEDGDALQEEVKVTFTGEEANGR